MPAKKTNPESGVDQSKKAKPHLCKLSNGVILQIRSISPSVMMRMYSDESDPEPKPPTYYVDSLGREEENPDDPDYLEAVRAHKARRAEKMTDVFFVMGTDLHSCPKDIEAWNNKDAEWIQELDVLGMADFKNKRDQYLAWLKAVALIDQEDYQKILLEVGRKSGVREEDVQKASESFRSDEERDSD